MNYKPLDIIIDLEVQNDILKFADDTKLYGIVTNTAQAESMQ